MGMEKVLGRLFDYQRFEQDRDLDRVIEGVHGRYAVRELDLDELETVAAAGAPMADTGKGKKEPNSLG